MAFATVGALLVTVILTATSVPTVQESPEADQVTVLALFSTAKVALAKGKEVLPTTRVRPSASAAVIWGVKPKRSGLGLFRTVNCTMV